MLTGHATIENAVEGVRLGAADYLTKPVDVDDIAEKIETCLDKRQSIDAQSVRRTDRFKKIRLQLFLSISGILLLFYALFFQVGYSWLSETCQVLMTSRSLTPIYSYVCRHNQKLVVLLAAVMFLIPIGTWAVVGLLVNRIQTITQKRDELQFQLFHASKLASIGELAAGVAHEINNPLAIIVARCGIIEDFLNPSFNKTPEPEKILDEIKTISQAAFRAQRITRQLIDFGQKKKPDLVPYNVNQILDEIIDELKAHDFKQGNIEIIRDYAANIPTIPLDLNQIKQVFLNLLNNANEAISESGTITISTREKNDYLNIAIEDTGSGMTPGQMKRIFKPFYTTKKVGTATGLSLSVSLSIVESLGGTIDVQSMEGVGSTFTVSLPL
ncbi:ATP-binding protein [bacterium]|nr:ATP-binding protein [bacterium]